ncbi:MAG: hypothetical protein EZS28_021762 [Streblomastix strix]|uniref:RRM domain-containing protein n=1 Tax=Streblomastix strix TaxID=222440 RepID=A0A5J4VJH5_9EUKA|nr:MAG: hypothetical protein EZS28_021762 [Streblomastix strix]
MATSSRLFIGNLNYKTNAETIGHLFETIGAVDNVKITSKNGKSLGYGFIEMADVESAERAQLQLNRHILDGRQIRVEFAKERKMKIIQNIQNLKKINKSYDIVQIEKKEKDPNSHYYKTRIADQITKIMKERICPLIHLNCQTDLNCQQCINIPQSPAIIELKSAIFQTLAEVSNDNKEFIDMLVNDHNIIPHLTHPLIYLNRNDNICKVVINTPKALHSLITLTSYKISIHFSQKNDQQSFKVRHSSRVCLEQILLFGVASAQTELVNTNYARVLVIAISTASGSGEEQDEEIFYELVHISKFLRHLYQEDYSFPPQPLLVRRSVEQIEEEGGNEEIDSQLINKGYRGNIKDELNEVKGEMLNYFIEQGNTRPDWYNW